MTSAPRPRESVETIFLVDDDPAICKALSRAIGQEGWSVETFGSAEAFLAKVPAPGSGCLVLDVDMPGLNGLDLQRELAARGRDLPIVFLSGHGDIPMSVRAMKQGAADFLTKPVNVQSLLEVVRSALERDASTRESREELSRLKQRFGSLTTREREVLVAIASGRLNKQIAADLGVVEQTIKFHRARIMERMQARTVAELMHIAARLDIRSTR